MASSPDRKVILAALDGWLADAKRERVLEGKQPSNEHPAFFMEVPRLIVGLEGGGRFSRWRTTRRCCWKCCPGK